MRKKPLLSVVTDLRFLTQLVVLPQSPSTGNPITESDDPKAMLQELKTKNRGRPVIAHLNINFLDPKFEQLVDIIKDNVDI